MADYTKEDIEKAIDCLDDEIDFSGTYNGEKNEKILTIILAALHEYAERHYPQPLSLDELKGMEGQPVWMNKRKEWGFISTITIKPYEQVYYFNSNGFAKTVLYYHEVFYRYQPKEES